MLATARPSAASDQEDETPPVVPGPLTAGSIRGYALFWLAGLGFLWWPVLAVRALSTRQPTRRADVFPVLIAALLVLSLVWAAVRGAEVGRLAGASFNLVVWVALALLSRLRLDVMSICRGVAQLAALQSVAVLLAFAVYPAVSGLRLPATLVLPGSLTDDPAFESFTVVRLITEDYFGETVLRSAGFFGNATWGGALSALGLLCSLPLLARARRPVARFGYGVFLVLDAVVLYLSYSRNTWIAVAGALVAMAVVVLWRRGGWFSLTVLATSAVGGVAWLVGSQDVNALFADFNSVREGSLDSRTAIYSLTWQAVVDSSFPLLGNGVKDRVPGLVASLGTHGTYLGILYRGGWLVAVLLVVWLLVLAARAWRSGSPLGVGAAVFAAVWFVAEDVDAGHMAPLALLIAVAATQTGEGWAGAHRDQRPRRPDGRAATAPSTRH